MQNKNIQLENPSEYDKPKNDSEHQLIDRISNIISTAKNWVNETIHPNNKIELEQKTGDLLTHVAEETIKSNHQSDSIDKKEKSDVIDAVGAAAEQTIDGGLGGQPGNPVETLNNDGYGPELIETTVAIAEIDRDMAEKIADEIDRVEGFESDSSKKEIDKYLEDANRNLLATSRTANGTVDVSASSTKAESMASIDGNEAAEKAKDNFNKSIISLFEQRDRDFATPDEMKDFIEEIAAQINEGIVKEGSLIRSGVDSDKYPYTRLEDLPTAMQNFYTELQQRLSDANSDPIETAAFCEYHIDLVDHFFADGCGKVAKAISSYVLMREGLPLPEYKGGRKEYYEHAPTQIAGINPEADKLAWQNFLEYYKTMLGSNA